MDALYLVVTTFNKGIHLLKQQLDRVEVIFICAIIASITSLFLVNRKG